MNIERERMNLSKEDLEMAHVNGVNLLAAMLGAAARQMPDIPAVRCRDCALALPRPDLAAHIYCAAYGMVNSVDDEQWCAEFREAK